MTPQDALVRVARFHARLVSDDDCRHDISVAEHFLQISYACLQIVREPRRRGRAMVVSSGYPLSTDLVEVRIVEERVLCRDLQAESAPWIEIAEDLSYEEVEGPDVAENNTADGRKKQ